MTEFVRYLHKTAKPIAPRLPQLDIELTERCNNDCIHCCINQPANDSAARARELTTAQLKDVLKQAADLGCLQVRFTGGEPLLRPDFEEVYTFARRLGLKVWLFTNGRLITPQLADLFARIPPLALIEITVYGMHQESYEAVTQAPGSFAQFRRGVSLLLERTIPFVVKSALLPQNKREMDEFEAWAKTIPSMSKPPLYAISLDLRSRRDNPKKNRFIESLRVPPQDRLAMMTRDATEFRLKMAAFGSKFMGPRGDVLFGCGAGRDLCVDAYGRIQPCMSLRAPELMVNIISKDLPAGEEKSNLLPCISGGEATGALAKALIGFRQLSDLRAENPEYLSRCGLCFLKGLCEQCPAKSWMEHGNLDTPVEYLCEMSHAQARYLGWLHQHEHAWEVVDWRERVSNQQEQEGPTVVRKEI